MTAIIGDDEHIQTQKTSAKRKIRRTIKSDSQSSKICDTKFRAKGVQAGLFQETECRISVI